MSDKKPPTKPLAKVDNPNDFVLPFPGVAFVGPSGNTVDLRTIDRRAAEALANNKRVQFLQWAEGKGPKEKAADAPPAKPPAGK